MTDDDEREERRDPEPTRFGALDALQVVFGVLACSGVFFYVNGPAKNPAHALFRLGVMAAGGVGLLVVTVLKLNGQRHP